MNLHNAGCSSLFLAVWQFIFLSDGLSCYSVNWSCTIVCIFQLRCEIGVALCCVFSS